MTESVVSSTDLQIFKRLANPDIADVELLPVSSTKEAQRKATASMRAAIEKAAGNTDEAAAAPATSAAPRSALEAAMDQARNAALSRQEKTQEPRVETPPQSPKSNKACDDNSPMCRQEGGGDTRHKAPPLDGDRPPPPSYPPPPEPSVAPERRRSQAPEPASDSEDDRTRSSGARASERGHDERMEKQGYLIELRRMQARGVQLSRRFTESDSLEELEFEVAKQNAAISTENSVSFMRDMLRLVITGLEIGNNKLGPFLSIDGWAEATTQDMHRYDHALERLHRRYFRKQQMSPIMEMGWLLLGSLAMWHFKSKFLGVTPASRPSEGSNSEPPATSKRRAAAAGMMGSAGGRSAATRAGSVSDSQSGRPVLRAPGNLFGLGGLAGLAAGGLS